MEEDYCGCRSRRAAEGTAALSLSLLLRSATVEERPAVEERAPQFKRFYTVPKKIRFSSCPKNSEQKTYLIFSLDSWVPDSSLNLVLSSSFFKSKLFSSKFEGFEQAPTSSNDSPSSSENLKYSVLTKSLLTFKIFSYDQSIVDI